jgi:hypothetical protein
MAVELATLVVGDEPAAWADAGFTVDQGACRIGQVRVLFLGAEGRRGIVAWSFRGLTERIGVLDGLPVGPSEPEPAGAPVPHPNGSLVIDHVVLMTPDGERTTAALTAAGLEARRVREIPGSDKGSGPTTQTFFRMGRPILELVARPGRGEGPASFFGLALDVADIDALPERYGDRLGRVKDAVQPGRRIATLRHEELGLSVPIAFMTPDERRPARQ